MPVPTADLMKRNAPWGVPKGLDRPFDLFVMRPEALPPLRLTHFSQLGAHDAETVAGLDSPLSTHDAGSKLVSDHGLPGGHDVINDFRYSGRSGIRRGALPVASNTAATIAGAASALALSEPCP